MATTVTKVIDPDMGSGYDYDSLYDWEAAQQGDLTGVRDEIAVAKCRCTGGTADTTAVTTDGWTTSATQYTKIWTDTAESYRHNGTYQTGNKYRITATILSEEDYSVIDGLQFGISDGAYGFWTSQARANSSNLITISNCIFRGPGSGTSTTVGIVLYGDNARLCVVNTVIFNFVTGTSASIPCRKRSSSTVMLAYNVTLIGGYCGFETYEGDPIIAKNCYAGGQGAGGSYAGTVTKTTCASSDTTGSVGLQSIAVNTTNFTNVTSGSEDFHLPSGSALIGAATNLYNDANYPFQTDIDGQDRGGAAAAWDIGADEYVSAATIEQEGFRFRNDDGSESAATWKANQDTNISLAADTAARIRMMLNATGDPASIGAQLEYRYKPSGGAFGSWTKVN